MHVDDNYEKSKLIKVSTNTYPKFRLEVQFIVAKIQREAFWALFLKNSFVRGTRPDGANEGDAEGHDQVDDGGSDDPPLWLLRRDRHDQPGPSQKGRVFALISFLVVLVCNLSCWKKFRKVVSWVIFLRLLVLLVCNLTCWKKFKKVVS